MPEIREFVIGFVGVIIGLVVAVALLPVIGSTIAAANLTGTEALMVGLVPTLVGVGILLFAVKSLF
jgi:phosphoribosylcarboxyaminoimidazole (NCAIR) mutase